MVVIVNLRRLYVLFFCAVILAACSGTTPTKDTLLVENSSTTIVIQEEPDADLCEEASSGKNIDCDDENLIFEESLEGATERLLEEKTWNSDLQYLLLNDIAYNQLLAPTLGEAALIPGGAMPIYGFYVDALNKFSDPLSWQQDWRLNTGTTLVEQIVLLPTADDAVNVFDLWKDSALTGGLKGIDESTGYYFTTTYSDPESIYSDRTCAVQSIAAVSRFLVSVTYLTGGDCKVAPSLLAANVLRLLVTRIDAVFPD